MEWHKDPSLKYTDLCIYIDENISKIVVPGEHPDIEDKIYNYLWLLVKALAIKKSMFQNFGDYDPYAFYAANRLFFALRKNLLNQGKTIKGKQIRPIKSCLNYTKALLNPMKIEYQREAYREIIDEEFVSKKFDAFTFKEQMRDEARSSQMKDSMLSWHLQEVIEHVGDTLNTVLEKLPFKPNTVEYKRIKISILLNCLSNLKNKKKLTAEGGSIIVWKLPKSMSNYIRILLKEFYAELANEIMECYKASSTDNETLDMILGYREGADYDYED